MRIADDDGKLIAKDEDAKVDRPRRSRAQHSEGKAMVLSKRSSHAAPASGAALPSKPSQATVVSAPKPSPASPAPGGSGAVVPQVPSASVPKPAAVPKTTAASAAQEVSEEGVERDLSKVPSEIERKMEELDVDGALRPTILKAGTPWSKREQKALLAAASERSLGTDEQKTERQRAFDLLDALTKSGALALESAALHVIIAATHCFDKTLMNTLVQDNINPVEKVERSALILASTVHNRRPAELLQPDQLQRVATYSPMLIEHSYVNAIALLIFYDVDVIAGDGCSEQEAAGAVVAGVPALKKL
jgi:hypothetical protein